MKIQYYVGRSIPDTVNAYDLEGCSGFDTLDGAVLDLIERTKQSVENCGPGSAGFLGLLRCECNEEGDVERYDLVSHGDIMEACVSIFDASAALLSALQGTLTMLDLVIINGKCAAFADITGTRMGEALPVVVAARAAIDKALRRTP